MGCMTKKAQALIQDLRFFDFVIQFSKIASQFLFSFYRFK